MRRTGPGAAALPGQITVSGTVRYTASDGTLHPARGITVQVWDANGTNSAVLPPVTGTDANGQYSVAVSSTRADGTPRHLFIRALARSTARSAGSPAFVVRAPGATVAHHMASAVHLASGPAMTLNVIGRLTGANQIAFAVADALTTGIDYTRRINGGELFPPLIVSYPDSDTDYNSSTRTIRLQSAWQFEWDTILHEYGHHAGREMGIGSGTAGGEHEFEFNLAQTRGKGTGILRAWSEGFAFWFSVTAQDVEGVAALAIPGAGDLFIDTDPYHVDLALNDGLASLGEDNELSVARALMAFRLDPGINMSDTAIIDALRAARAQQLSTAVIALMADASAANFDDFEPVNAARVALSNDFACVLTAQAVAPKITTPPPGTHLISGPPALTYTWEPGGAGPDYPLDQFTVQFWSENWDTLLFESPQQTATTYTPDPAQLDQIFNILAASGARPNTINVVVKGRSTDAPATGPYKSCAITQPVDLDPVLTVTPLDPAHALVPYSPIYWEAGLPLAASQFTLVARQQRSARRRRPRQRP